MLPQILTDPIVWVVLLVVMIGTATLADCAARKPQEPKPFAVPKVEPVTAWPPQLRTALMELVALAVNQGTTTTNFNLTDLHHRQLKLGSWRITIEKIED